MGAVCAALEEAGVTALVRKVPYEFQKGGSEMLVLCRA
jgi:hypothetical protein